MAGVCSVCTFAWIIATERLLYAKPDNHHRTNPISTFWSECVRKSECERERERACPSAGNLVWLTRWMIGRAGIRGKKNQRNETLWRAIMLLCNDMIGIYAARVVRKRPARIARSFAHNLFSFMQDSLRFELFSTPFFFFFWFPLSIYFNEWESLVNAFAYNVPN